MQVSGSFNLQERNWIPVLLETGEVAELSLLDFFERSPGTMAILGELPTQGFAILRLALAILHQSVDGPEDHEAWQELWDGDGPPMDDIESYLDRYSERFDLFHPTTPFFQVADLHTAKNEHSGLEKLIADVPAGHPYFTTRAGRGLESISPAEAARWLVHAQAWDVSGIKSGAVGDSRVKGGKGYPIGTGWAGAIGGLYVEGANLWQTLLLNLIPRDQPNFAAFDARDRPAWEAEPDGPAEAPDAASRPYGPLDLYTWQSRRIRLIGDVNGITGVVLANGDRITPQNRNHIEPMTRWRRSIPQQKALKLDLVYMPQRHDPSRALWRGLESMLPVVSPRGRADGGQDFVTAGVVEWASIALEGSIKVRLRAIGMEYGPQSATVTDIVNDQLTISIATLSQANPTLANAAIEALRATEDGVRALRFLAANVARAAGADQSQADGARDRASERAYAELDAPFRSWLARLDDQTDPLEQRMAWHGDARRILRRMGADIVGQSGTAAWIGREVNGRRITSPEADGWFQAALVKALPLPAPTEEVHA